MNKFVNIIHGLDDLEILYDPMVAKINFWNNMKDKVYKITKKISSMDDSKMHANHLNEIKRKSIEV